MSGKSIKVCILSLYSLNYGKICGFCGCSWIWYDFDPWMAFTIGTKRRRQFSEVLRRTQYLDRFPEGTMSKEKTEYEKVIDQFTAACYAVV